MALTADRYIPDGGRVSINSVDQSGSVKTLSHSPPRRTTREIHTLGGSATEALTRAKAGNYEIAMQILDDRSLDEDQTGAMYALWNAYYTNTTLTNFAVSPAGTTVGMSEFTYSDVEVVQCPPHGNMDADTEEEAIADVILTAGSVSVAAIV